MEPPTKKTTFRSVFARYKSKKNSLPDFSNPPEDFDPVPLRPQENSSLEMPRESETRQMAPRNQDVFKPRNTLERRGDSSPITQQNPSMKKAAFDLHETYKRRNDFNKRPWINKAFSENIVVVEEPDTLCGPKPKGWTASMSTQSQRRNGARENPGTMLSGGVEEFRRVERQVNPSAILGGRPRPGRSSQRKRTSGLLSKTRPTIPPKQDNSRLQNHATSRTNKDSKDSVSDSDIVEPISMLQKSKRTYPQVIIYQPTNQKISLHTNLQPKGIDTRSAKPNDNHRDKNFSNDFESNRSAEFLISMNEQIATSRERQQSLERKTRHPTEVIDVTDFSEDELAHSNKPPKALTESRPNKDRAIVSTTAKPPKPVSWPPKIVKRLLDSNEHQVLSIFSETHYWLRPQHRERWHLHQNHSNGGFEFHDENQDPIHGLALRPQIIQKIQRSYNSEKLVIHKHRDTTANKSTKIFLELLSADDARQICNILKEHDATIDLVTLNDLSRAQLDQLFLNNRKLVEKLHQSRSRLETKSKLRTVEAESLQTSDAVEQQRREKYVKQPGTLAGKRRKAEGHGEPQTTILGKRKRIEEDAGPQAKTERRPRKIRSSDSSENDSLLPSVESSSIDPGSFYYNRTHSSIEVAGGEPAQKLPPKEDAPKLERWTEANPKWAQSWKAPVVYPRQGEKRFTTIVEKEDIERLDDGQLLNDNLINFYLCWLKHYFEKEYPTSAHRVYFHNTFFYKALTNTKKGTRGVNYEAVERWTSKVDLLAFDYIIVPINESTHWYVAIICNAPKLQGLQPAVISNLEPRDESSKSEDLGDNVNAGKSSHLTQSSLNTCGMMSRKALRSEEPCVDALMQGSSFNQRASYTEDEKSDVERSKDCTDLEKQKSCIEFCDESAETRGFKSTEEVVLDMDPSTKPSSRFQTKGGAKSYTNRKLDPSQPRIITLDSLGLKHSPTCTNLKNYLIAEIKSKKKIDIPPPGSLGMTAVNIPQQTNLFDCGIFLLSYIEQFLKDPDRFVHDIIQAHDLQIEFQTARSMRDHIRQILFKLQEGQIDEAEEFMAEKSNNRRRSKAENRLNQSKKASNIVTTAASTDNAKSKSGIGAGNKPRAQQNVGQSAVHPATGCKRPYDREGPQRDVVDVEISHMDPLTDCQSANPISSPGYACHENDKPHGQSTCSSSTRKLCPDSPEPHDTPEENRSSSAIVPCEDATTGQGQEPGSSYGALGVNGRQDPSSAKSPSQSSETKDDSIIVID